MSNLGERFLLAMTGHTRLSEVAGEVSDRLLNGLLNALTQIADPKEVFDLDAPVPAANDLDLARLFAGWAPEAARDRIGALLAGKRPHTDQPPARPASVALPDTGALPRLSRILAEEFNAADSDRLMVSLISLPTDFMQVVIGAAPPPGSRWDPVRIAKLIRDFIVKWLSEIQALALPGENSRRVLKDIDAEILGPLQKRIAVATALSIGSSILTSKKDLESLIGLPSSFKVGMEVHELLQADYRRTRRAHLIVQESIVYQQGRTSPLKLETRTDDSLFALWWARDSHLLRARKALQKTQNRFIHESSLRDDNLDLGIPDWLGTGAIWEIKPIRSAAYGVVQEFAYRTLFNAAVALLKDNPDLRRRLGGSNTKPLHFSCERIEPGTAARWPEVAAKVMLISGAAAEGGARTILVTTVGSLPGLVLYLRYDLPVFIVAALAKEVVRVLDQASKEMESKTRTALAWAAVIAMACVAILASFAAVLLAAAALNSAAIAALATALAPIFARIGVQLPQFLQSLQRATAPISSLVQEFAMTLEPVRNPADGTLRLVFRVREGVTPEQVPTASATVGPLRLENCPVAVLAVMDDTLAVAGPIAIASLLKAAKQQNGASSATS
ncbi:hypothetical protein [Streptomyces ehimensis]|uniref:Uncharacterized protein n=1 Tax=Streptomyces ehimensis TaxID=68195 RepID=A0ABV9BDJ6_9ACTN